MRTFSTNQLLQVMPALAVAALDARVHERVQDGYLTAEPYVGRDRTLQQSIDIRRAGAYLEECKIDVYHLSGVYFRRGRGAADLSRCNEAVWRKQRAEALYHAAWYAWYQTF